MRQIRLKLLETLKSRDSIFLQMTTVTNIDLFFLLACYFLMWSPIFQIRQVGNSFFGLHLLSNDSRYSKRLTLLGKTQWVKINSKGTLLRVVCKPHSDYKIYTVLQKYRHTRNFLETRVIIKMFIHPCCPKNFDWF